jgi:myo-inositol-1(or 4)-monophosphatase
LLRVGLTALYSAAWLSEETADSPARLDAASVWIVDPLDGTKEFIAGLPEYCVAVALVEDGVTVLGVLHNPATDEVFWAVRGGGAFLNGQPVSVREGNRMLASRSEVPRGEFEPFASRWDIVPTGSIQYKLGLIAAGRAAATLSRGPKHEWDICAGALIVEEAGGRASELLGAPLAYNQPFPKVKGILAGAPEAHTRALAEVKAVGASDRMDEFRARLGG